jgi:hypothetical protein
MIRRINFIAKSETNCYKKYDEYDFSKKKIHFTEKDVIKIK